MSGVGLEHGCAEQLADPLLLPLPLLLFVAPPSVAEVETVPPHAPSHPRATASAAWTASNESILLMQHSAASGVPWPDDTTVAE
jgi:hypothetical protein